MRSTNMTVVYPAPFKISGYPDELPAGSYELLVQEEFLMGPGAHMHRWTAAYLTVHRTARKGGQKDRRPLDPGDLATALRHRRSPE